MNRYVIVGWLGGNSEIFIHYDMNKGAQVARELRKSPTWQEAFAGSLIDLINLLEKAKK